MGWRWTPKSVLLPPLDRRTSPRLYGSSLDASRGQPRGAELYNLADDIAEERDLATEEPEKLAELRAKFDQVVSTGASREGIASTNDAPVPHEVTQAVRWAPIAE